MTTPSPTLAVALTAARVAQGMNQAQLAATSSVSPATISRIEAGIRTNPGTAVLRRLAEALDVPASRLLDLPSRPMKGRRKAA